MTALNSIKRSQKSYFVFIDICEIHSHFHIVNNTQVNLYLPKNGQKMSTDTIIQNYRDVRLESMHPVKPRISWWIFRTLRISHLRDRNLLAIKTLMFKTVVTIANAYFCDLSSRFRYMAIWWHDTSSDVFCLFIGKLAGF